MARKDKQGAVDVITGDEALTLEQVPEIESLFEDCLDHGQPMIVFDMQQIRVVDGRGLELLLDTSETCQARGGELRLAGVSRLIQEAMEITGIANRFDWRPSVREAVGSFSK